MVKGGHAKLASEAPGKYDPLGWLSEPVPVADDPLRAFIRRVAQVMPTSPGDSIYADQAGLPI